MTESQRRSTNSGLATANFGQKYEQHMRRMDLKLKEQQLQIEELDKKQKAIEYELENSFKELNTARDNLRNVEYEKNTIQIDLIGTRRQITALNRELCDLNAVNKITKTHLFLMGDSRHAQLPRRVNYQRSMKCKKASM